MTNRWCGDWIAVILYVCIAGCSPSKVESGPSYAELVVTYNAELEALDRLEAKRDELIKEYAAASAPNESVDTLANLEGLLKAAKDLNDGTNLDAASDPNAQLDDVIERQAGVQELAGQLLDGLGGGEPNPTQPDPTPEEAAAIAERKAEFEAELATLDSEISKQKERVQRAREARDASEVASH